MKLGYDPMAALPTVGAVQGGRSRTHGRDPKRAELHHETSDFLVRAYNALSRK